MVEKEGLKKAAEISASADWQRACTFNPGLWIIDWRGDEGQLLFSSQAGCLTQSAASLSFLISVEYIMCVEKRRSC